MGFELNRIMKQYGVGTPTMASYSGTAAPGEQPTAPTLVEPVKNSSGVITKALNKAQIAANQAATDQYNKDLAAWNETKAKYEADKPLYDAYTADYQNRLQNTPMYSMAQFQTGPSAGMKEAIKPGGIGVDAYNKNITDWFTANPNAKPVDVRSAMDKHGISGYDVAQARGGSMWGDPVKAPVFSNPVVTPTANTQNTVSLTTDEDGGVTVGPNNQTLYNYNGTPMYQMNTPTGTQWNTYTGYKGDISALPTYSNPSDWYAHGGRVRTHYQEAGAVTLPSGYATKEDEEAWGLRFKPSADVQTFAIKSPDVAEVDTTSAPVAPLTDIAVKTAKDASTPVNAVTPAVVAQPVVKPALPFGDERMANIQALLSAYGPQGDTYGPELKLARERAKKESDAFSTMLEKAMSSPENEQTSKAEMYFRLAAAFGSPTKTGQFTENLGMVGKELGEYAKGKREASKEKLALALKGQELRMGAAKEDLATLRSLSAEEMKDKRTIATELIKDYIKSGEPQSAAGKQALDEGLKPGTPEYQKRVAAIGNMNVEGKMAQINATLANLSIAQANLALRQQNAAKLSGPELTLKRETEDTVATIKQSLGDLKQAYALNPNSLAGGWMDKGQQWLAEAAGSKDPTIVNTRILNNLLGAQGLAKLKTTFGGNPTEGERAILLELEGIGSKTKEERGAIIRRTYKVLQEKQAREQRRLDDINSGAYRMTTPIEGGSE